MKNTVLAGARRMRTRRTHRAQFAAAAVALVLVGGVVGGVLATTSLHGEQVSPPAVSASPSPTASPEPSPSEKPTATIAFGGACDQMLTESDAIELLSGTQSLVDSAALTGLEPALNESLALLGGLQCRWASSADFVWVDVLPATAVPQTDLDDTAMQCIVGPDSCRVATVDGGAWIHVTASNESLADTALARVVERNAGASPTPSPRGEQWWTVPACSSLTSLASDAFGGGMVEGIPTDYVPSSVGWRLAVSNGVAGWCGWSGSNGSGSRSLEVSLQPGIGAPDADAVSAVSAVPVEVTGADGAFTVPFTVSESGLRVVAFQGENRLTVTGTGFTQDDLVAAATRVLGALAEAAAVS